MEQHINELFTYVQERCLWQFFSRTWDREQNISGILGMAEQMLSGEDCQADNPADRCNLADAKVLVADWRSHFPWIKALTATEINQVLTGLKVKLVDTTITHSRNRELNYQLY